MSDLPDSINRLASRLETLEQRVYVLEHRSPEPSSSVSPSLSPIPIAQFGEMMPSAQPGGVFSVLGKAMLGIAGAYLLRAVAESSSFPKPAVAALAIAYAIMWLVWAARVKDGEWLASTTYACTSALILAPMLWELTLRFKVLPASMAAVVLCGFVIVASALAWRRNLASVFWVANVTAALAALALAIASHQMAPFVASLLIMVVICELAAGLDHAFGVRPLVAAAADLGVLALVFIYSSPQSAHIEYPNLGMAALLAPGFLLFLVFGVSVIFKTVLKQMKITVFESIQTMIALLLAASGLLYFGPASRTTILGISCLVLSAASYATVFAFFDRASDRVLDRRNYLVFATWSAALFLAGSLLCLPPLWMAVCLGAAAVVATVLGARLERPVLEFHGAVFLLAAAAVSGLLIYVFRAMAGRVSGAPEWSVCLVSICAAICYAAVKPCRRGPWKQQVFQIISASLAISAAGAMLVEGLFWLIALSVNPGAHHLAFIRTLTICVAALALAFSGSHWRRMELTRMGYAMLVLVAAKLAIEDLRLGHLAFIAASIFLFAITLIAVPRIARMGQ
jgi:hypothetical protein